MTTHDQQILTDSPEEPPVPVSAATPDPAPADTVPPVTDTAAPDINTAAPAAETDEVEPPTTKHEPSGEEELLAGDDLADLRARWAGVQAAFVDDPKECVQKADVLVSDLVEQLTTGFAQARSRLEEQWSRGKEASTEDLRLALMHYRE
ncbi:MAG: hypothetical protein ACLQGN_26890, partial [Mycobacterium sp.]